jgi:ABC-type polysaccharide/polyol phosphate export permease
LGKKQFAGIAFLMSAVLTVLFFLYLPIEIDGQRMGNVPLLLINAGLLAVTASILVVSVLIVILKKEYVKKHLATLVHFRHLVFLMVKRDFITRYRRSVLGVLWSLLNPILTMLVLTMVFSHIFRFEIPGVSFAVYLLSGQLIFGFFSESTSTAMLSVLHGAGTIKKVYVPKYIFPVTRVLSSVVNLGFSFLAFLIVFLVTGTPFHPTIFLIPVPILYVMVFSMGVGMFLSSAAVFFRDITYIYGVFLTLLNFLTPIFWPVSILTPRVYHFIHLNPMFHYVGYFRDLAIYGVIPGLWANIICIGFALAALFLGLYVKMSQQDKYILYL